MCKDRLFWLSLGPGRTLERHSQGLCPNDGQTKSLYRSMATSTGPSLTRYPGAESRLGLGLNPIMVTVREAAPSTLAYRVARLRWDARADFLIQRPSNCHDDQKKSTNTESPAVAGETLKYTPVPGGR